MKRSTTTFFALAALQSLHGVAGANVNSIDSLRSTWGLTAANFTFEPPSKAMQSDDAVDWIEENWSLADLSWGEDDM